MKKLALIIILCCLTCCFDRVLAENFTGFVGQVTNYATEKPISEATLKLIGFTDAEEVFSDSNGYFKLPVPIYGIFNIEVSANSYETSTYTYQEVRKNETATLAIELSPVSPTAIEEETMKWKWKNEMAGGTGLPDVAEASLAIATKPINYIPATIKVLINPSDPPQTIIFEEYLKGVVSAEIGGGPLEALKAQAIASRTYSLLHLGEHQKENADVCINPNCCHAWKKAGVNGYRSSITQAIKKTANRVIKYNGKIIDALYFSHCEGKTKSSGSSYGFPTKLNYLVSTSCLCNVEFTIDKKFQQDLKKFNESDSKKRVKNEVSKYYHNIGNLYLKESTTEMWLIYDTKLNMGFRFKLTDNNIDAYVIFGHLIGMCQNGANLMAQKRILCDDILHHYYTDVEITTLPSEPTTVSTKFQPKDTVSSTEKLNVRSTPEIRNDNIIEVLAKDSLLEIIAHPDNGLFTDGHYWWKIGNGWCAEDYLKKIAQDNLPLGKPGKPMHVDKNN